VEPDPDFKALPSGKEVRWQNQARWQRFALQKNGYLRDDSPSGTWEITEEGRRLYESMKRNT